ncbi:hypothetical protein [Solibacillus sp. R5-41]|uniref:hypothetical protein n=1 Tax=Solibacillus sp. R5-41 TaxID=2048654 RepID=UPI0012FE39D1|nr:hypothetical protein [Solibacillus sp. R5-41]
MINHFTSSILVALFIYFPLTLLLLLGGIVLFILSVVHIFRRYKKTRVKSFLPLILSVTLIFLVIDRPLSPLFQNVEFSFKLDKREEVARQIINGEIKPSNESGNLFLVPKKYNNFSLSDGNEVMKMNDKLFFFTVRGILDNFSGYVFSPRGLEPTNEDVQATIIRMQKLNNNWYFVSCT